MDTILLGHTPEGLPIYFDRVASASDHIVVVNRIKPHTRLVGRYESGLIKMMMIGRVNIKVHPPIINSFRLRLLFRSSCRLSCGFAPRKHAHHMWLSGFGGCI